MSNLSESQSAFDRRKLLSGGAVLSVGALMALGDVASPAFAKPKKKGHTAGDVGLLNAAIALEHEGISVYDIGLGSGLIPAEAVRLVTKIQSDHKKHRDLLAETIERLGGKPDEAKPQADYIKALDIGAIKTLPDLQHLALKLETGATNAYLGLITPLATTEHRLLVARLAADEATHVAVFTLDLKQDFGAAPMFG